jgi:hypothetical protein
MPANSAIEITASSMVSRKGMWRVARRVKAR